MLLDNLEFNLVELFGLPDLGKGVAKGFLVNVGLAQLLSIVLPQVLALACERAQRITVRDQLEAFVHGFRQRRFKLTHFLL